MLGEMIFALGVDRKEPMGHGVHLVTLCPSCCAMNGGWTASNLRVCSRGLFKGAVESSRSR